MRAIYVSLAILGLATAVSGCTPIGVGIAAGSTAGVAAAREGGLKSSLEDTRIRAEINDLWLKHNFDMFRKVNLTVDQGRVLLTGVVQKPQDRVDAVRLSWQPSGVRQVINEIKVDNSEGIKGWARDTWISGRLRSVILFDKDIQSINYSIDTVQGVVYLMGIAQNQAELDKVMLHARSTPYVKQVTSYVKLAGQPLDPAQVPPQPGMQAQPVPQQGVVGGVGSVQTAPLGTTGAPRAPVAGRPAPIVDQGF